MASAYNPGRIFIIGGQGFVGSALTRYCQAHEFDHQVITPENYPGFVGETCDVLINANGNSWKPLAMQQPLKDFEANVTSVRKSLIDFTFTRYVYFSSCDVYPDCSYPDITPEDTIIDPAVLSPYGFHKLLAECCVRHAAHNWLILRPGGFVGPGLRKNAIFDILNSDKLWLQPASRLQFIHVDQAAALVFELLRMNIENEIFNLSSLGTIGLDDVISNTGRELTVQPGSPLVRYEVSLEKLGKLVDLPETRQTVLDYIQSVRLGRP